MDLQLTTTKDNTRTMFENCYENHTWLKTNLSNSRKACEESKRQRNTPDTSREVNSKRIGRPIGSDIETGRRDEIIGEDLSEMNGGRSLRRGEKTETSAGGARSDDGTRNTDTMAERIREKRDNNPHQRELGEVEDKNRQDRRSAQRDVQEETNRSQIAAEKRGGGRDTEDAMATAAVEEEEVKSVGGHRNPSKNPYQQRRGEERERRLPDSSAEKIDRLDRVEETSSTMEISGKPAKRLERDERSRRDQREDVEGNPTALRDRKKEEKDKDEQADTTLLSKSKGPGSKRTADSVGDVEKGRSVLNEERKLPVSNRRRQGASTDRRNDSGETRSRATSKRTLVQNMVQHKNGTGKHRFAKKQN
ncbi:vicilin-like seed storage protein At2g18540 [Solenopsis invicta]|uniref:vicilin-like seed storage protein At2g18540 n=1 Tax=Solenopsis invicta TaxID=13686 RepID=UPI00193E5B28|nr:vicilin-like seed storage protein At2g18540 [Solenopsis invicta]XP_025988483.2 vicilin-like seed storage protein At2g18540 [Solenopsis invicta]